MGMAERIKERRKAMGYTQTELGEKLGLQASAIAKYENGRVKNMKRSVIANMANILECSPTYLMGLEHEEKTISLNNTYPIEIKRFPLLGEIACGIPTYASEDRESYVMAGTDIKADFCLIAKGDSMVNARIHEGDIVFIRKQDIVNNGEIAAVITNDDNEATLKRFYHYPEKNMVILKAENPTYEDMIFINEELENFHVLGKAVAFQSDVK